MKQKSLRDQRGAISAEYALLAPVIAVACVTTVSFLGKNVPGLLSAVVIKGRFNVGWWAGGIRYSKQVVARLPLKKIRKLLFLIG
jgi:Flp pilus assembly pilin Flp